MAPVLPRPQVPSNNTSQHHGPSGYRIPNANPSQQGRTPSFAIAPEYILPRAEADRYPHFVPPVQSQNGHYPAPYNLVPVPGHPQHMTITSLTQNNAASTTKPKKKPGRPKGSKGTSKSKVTKPAKVKQRPQSSKHLTPSLRAAIIAIKLTNPNKSFKEIGEILAFPDDDEDEDEDEPSSESQGQIETSSTARNGKASKAAAQPAATDSSQAASAKDSSTQAEQSTQSQTSEGPASSSATANSSKANKKSKVRDRKPIPRNTVAGIFKRAVTRAGTDDDIWKLLEQTTRRPGSGRPMKGTGKKDRERAASAAGAKTNTNVDGDAWRAEFEQELAAGGGLDLDDEGDMNGLDLDMNHEGGDDDGWDSDDGNGSGAGAEDGEAD